MSASVACAISASLTAAQAQAKDFSEGTMTATVLITRRNAPGALDYTTGLVADPNTTIYHGKARVGVVQGASQLILGDEQQYFSTVDIAIPLDAPQVIIDDMVQIETSLDPHVVNRLFRVADVGGGGDLPVAQTLTAVGVARSRGNG